MIKKSLKKKMVMALAGIILAGSLGWSQIPARAAVNGESICAHENAIKVEDDEYCIKSTSQGHIMRRVVEWDCYDCNSHLVEVTDGDFEAHDFDKYHDMIEDLHNGLYMHWIKCSECGYEDEVLSDDPNDPKA